MAEATPPCSACLLDAVANLERVLDFRRKHRLDGLLADPAAQVCCGMFCSHSFPDISPIWTRNPLRPALNSFFLVSCACPRRFSPG